MVEKKQYNNAQVFDRSIDSSGNAIGVRTTPSSPACPAQHPIRTDRRVDTQQDRGSEEQEGIETEEGWEASDMEETI